MYTPAGPEPAKRVFVLVGGVEGVGVWGFGVTVSVLGCSDWGAEVGGVAVGTVASVGGLLSLQCTEDSRLIRFQPALVDDNVHLAWGDLVHLWREEEIKRRK